MYRKATSRFAGALYIEKYTKSQTSCHFKEILFLDDDTVITVYSTIGNGYNMLCKVIK